MLRFVTPLFVVLAAVAAAPAFATGKAAYASLAVGNADACARACAEDSLCMAWSFHAAGACELTATVPAVTPEGALAFGVAGRAPAALRPTPEPQAAQAPIADPAPIVEDTQRPTFIAAIDADADLVLLGGPEESDLRPRLPARQ